MKGKFPLGNEIHNIVPGELRGMDLWKVKDNRPQGTFCLMSDQVLRGTETFSVTQDHFVKGTKRSFVIRA